MSQRTPPGSPAGNVTWSSIYLLRIVCEILEYPTQAAVQAAIAKAKARRASAQQALEAADAPPTPARTPSKVKGPASTPVKVAQGQSSAALSPATSPAPSPAPSPALSPALTRAAVGTPHVRVTGKRNPMQKATPAPENTPIETPGKKHVKADFGESKRMLEFIDADLDSTSHLT